MPLSDIVACSAEELQDLITSEEPYEQGAWFLSKGIAMIELSQLGEMLGVGSYDELMDGFEFVGDELEDGPWPQTIPAVLTTRLASLSDEEIAEVVPRWAGIEEFRGRQAPEELAEHLKELRTFLTENAGPYFLVNSA
jgi:hypothetical protein